MPHPDDATDEPLIVVIRSGGFGGLRRTWTAAVGRDEERWLPLVEACPWNAVRDDATSRDRFIWHIEARISTVRRTADVPEAELTGPWKELVTRVQEAGA
ncbi:protealysin inhibitor emfourin [Microbacterium sp. G2-8]|uniref:protealysin inhibitor emfourin n=1 Tax=Microbacterium sp. G2-8 TaxID=2842454 RepID=UPI001C898B8C|nr:protealysin inhibitor emfourin [Microbacterium sp. G2-8]